MNFEKFKQMPLGQKIQWLVQYYGIAAAAILVAAIVIAKLLFAMFGPRTDYVLRVLILDEKVSVNTQEQMREELGEMLGCEIDLVAYMPDNMYQSQAFAVRLTADELDFVISPEGEMTEMTENGFIVSSKELDDDSYYCKLTARDGFEEGEKYYIGVTVKSTNDRNIPAGYSYFCNAGTR